MMLAVLKFLIGTLLLYTPEYREVRGPLDIENVLANIILASGCVTTAIFAAMIVYKYYSDYFRVLKDVKPDNLVSIAAKLLTKGKLRCKHAYRKSSTGMVCIYCGEKLNISGGGLKQ